MSICYSELHEELAALFLLSRMLLRPVYLRTDCTCSILTSFTANAIRELEVSHPELVASMAAPVVKTVMKDEQGKFRSPVSKRVVFDPHLQPFILRADANYGSWIGDENGGVLVAGVLIMLALKQPFCFETAHSVLDHIKSEPTGQIAEMWRQFIRTTLVPELVGISKLLEANASTFELPPADYVNER
eukprot:SAG31_NODE_2591_length_5425_cov_4.004694_1_plen_188_part_00